MIPIIVLFFGGGQDSTTILFKYVYDAEFRKTYFGDKKLIVVMSDTGNEYPATYDYIKRVIVPFCQKYKIEFYFLTSKLGFHNEHWQTLEYQFQRNNTVMGVTFNKSCTSNLKIEPSYKFIDKYLSDSYGIYKGKKGTYYEYAKLFGKLTVIIGFAKGEESRMIIPDQPDLFPEIKPKRNIRPVWMDKNVEVIYPLISVGYDRKECQSYISELGYEVPPPSNCMFCPFQNGPELVYLYRTYPERFQDWVDYEINKLTKFSKMKGKNYGVKGKKMLPEVIAELNSKYKEWSNEKLYEYRFSHGHCVKSKY